MADHLIPSVEKLENIRSRLKVLQYQVTNERGLLRDLLTEKGINLVDLDNRGSESLVSDPQGRIIARYGYTKPSDGRPLWLLEAGEFDAEDGLVFKSWIVDVVPDESAIYWLLNEADPFTFEAIEAKSLDYLIRKQIRNEKDRAHIIDAFPIQVSGKVDSFRG